MSSNAALRVPALAPVAAPATDVALEVPRLAPPYPARLNPAVADVELASTGWLCGFGIGEVARERALVCRGRFAWLAARAYPDATPARLRVIADFVTWAFLFDDHCEAADRDPGEVDRLCAAVIATCEGAGRASGSPLVRALADLRRRVIEGLGTGAAGFLGAVVRFVRAVQRQLELAGARPGFEEELRTRELTIGLYPCLHFIDPAGAAERAGARIAPAQVARDRLVAEVLCWTNDLISLPKELRAREPHNLVLALAAQRGAGLQAAVDEAVGRYHRALAGFAALDERCRTTPAEVAYSDGLRAWIAALPAWSYASARYAG